MAVHKVKASAGKSAENTFAFQMPGDKKTYRVPLLKYLRPALVNQLDGKDEMDVVEGLMDAYIPGLYEKFDDFEQIRDFYFAWSVASGVTLGESEASPESSETTERPSAATSS